MGKTIVKVESFRTWEELRAAALSYESKGISSEVRGWDDMRANKLTVYGDFGG